MKEAMYYKKIDTTVQCLLCPHKCLIPDGCHGKCLIRENQKGILYAKGYGRIVSAAVDPIEKKPLYHFYPGRDILSIGFSGCNMTCQFCQNYELSQHIHDAEEVPIELLIKKIEFGIAFTYNEPFINYEYMYDLSTALKRADKEKKVVVVTNGMINKEPLKKILPLIDAFNLDIKGDDDFYKSFGGHYQQVIDNIKLMNQKHLEVTILMVTDYVSLEDVREIAKVISQVNPKIPLHISRYFPQFNLVEAATDMTVLFNARAIAEEYLEHVYLGNIRMDQNTYCKKCNELLIKRSGYSTEIVKESCCYDNNILGV